MSDEDDGQVARRQSLVVLGGGSIPVVDWVTVGEVSESGVGTITAQIRDDGDIERVWARVFGPSFEPPESGDGSVPVIEVPEVKLEEVGGDVYEGQYWGFTERGVYQVVVYAVDKEGHGGMPRWVSVGECEVYLPLVLS